MRGLWVAAGGLRVLGGFLVLGGLLLVAAGEAAGVVGGPFRVLLAGFVLRVGVNWQVANVVAPLFGSR